MDGGVTLGSDVNRAFDELLLEPGATAGTEDDGCDRAVPEPAQATGRRPLATIAAIVARPCTFAVEHQDEAGAAGTVTCTGVQAMGAGTVDMTITFTTVS